MDYSQLVERGHQAFAENIKILLYRHDENIFNKVDFEDDKIYTDPLFFAIFNNNENKGFSSKDIDHLLNPLIFGYSANKEFKKNGCVCSSDEYGRIYFPKDGWYCTKFKNTLLHAKLDAKEKLVLLKDNQSIDYQFVSSYNLTETNIELLQYPHFLLKQFYPGNIYSEIDFTKKVKYHQQHLETALSIIRKYCPPHYNLIDHTIDKLIMFDIPSEYTNSFMSRSAYGASFFNVFQDDYDEVFLIDDVCHQTGHVIFEALAYERENFFKRNHLESIEVNQYEDRTIEVFFHALFTYHLILNCLSACLENDVFTGKKRHELEGRILHSLVKCSADLKKINREKANDFFTPEGMVIYDEIVKTYNRVATKWAYLPKKYSLAGQPYNFTYSVFLEKNKIQSEVLV